MAIYENKPFIYITLGSMNIKLYIVFLILFTCQNELVSQIFYFAYGNDIISYDLIKNKKVIVWKASFSITDISLNQTGRIITFTKYAGSADDYTRQAGYYILKDGKYEIIKSASTNNFGAVASPNSELIFFNTYNDNTWSTSLYNLNFKTLTYNALASQGNYAMPCGWQNDSVIQIIDFDKIILENIYDRNASKFPLSENVSEGISIPGTKCIIINDSLSFMNLSDFESSMESDGPPLNIYKIVKGKKEKLLNNNVWVDNFFQYGNEIFIGYYDYSSAKVKYKIGIFNIHDETIKTLNIDFAGEEYTFLGYFKNN